MCETSQETVISGYKAIRNREDEFSNLKNLKIPALVIAGSDDLSAPAEEMKAIADAVPESTFKIIKDCGHVSNLEKPKSLNQILLEWFGEI